MGEVGQALGLGRRQCNVCLVDDKEIKRLNSFYRAVRRATDVLSFPWDAETDRPRTRARARRAEPRHTCRSAGEISAPEFKHFLGDIVISVETARRNARRERHSTLNEIRWLILHGVLHLLGYDHESDKGEMAELELSLRQRLGI